MSGSAGLRHVPIWFTLFGMGVAAGWIAAGHHLASAAIAASSAAGTPVTVELTRAAPAASQESVKHLSLEAARQAKAAAEARTHLSAREIANRALEWTVFLRGGNVYGAGVLLDAQGHVLTCDHVIDGLEHAEASFDGDSTPIPVTIVARAGDLDLALLKLSKPVRSAPALRASIADVSMGDEVFAMGAPRKMTFSLSHGIVSYVGRSFDGTLYVQTDLSANSGSSGGPIMNDRGQLIGVSSFILRGSQGLTFAVPIDYAYKRFAAELGVRADTSRFDRWVESRQSDRDTKHRD